MKNMGAIRPGGQALADGVLMRTKLAWAIARADGTVESGPMPSTALVKVPGLRVLAGLAGGLRLGVGRGFIRGRGDAGNRRFLVVLAVTEVLALSLLFGLGPLAGGLPAPIGTAISLLAGAAALTLVRTAAPASLWRYHGAEHKAAAAFESGAEADDVDAALSMSRLHPRCGTNLLVPLSVVGVALSGLSTAAQLIGGVAALAFTAEAVTLAARRPHSLWSRALIAPGLLLQHHVTTSEPTREEQTVACHAMSTCLLLHHRIAETRTPVTTPEVVATLPAPAAI